jgi:HK97 family phage prohead protease
MKTERRLFTLDEFRVADDGKLIGHAAVFGKDSEEMWGFVERVAPGTFAETIKQDDIRALFNHDPNIVLGRNKAGTLKLSEDPIGLASQIEPPDTSAARDLAVSIRRGDISQMSFGFTVLEDEWKFDRENDMSFRTLTKVRLYDVSPVTFPAYPDTDVCVRSMAEIAAEGKRRLAEAAPQGVPLALRRRQLEQLERMG